MSCHDRERWLISWVCPFCKSKTTPIRYKPISPCFTVSCSDRADLGAPHHYSVVVDPVCCVLCTKCDESRAIASWSRIKGGHRD
jgi:hypothetical protein